MLNIINLNSGPWALLFPGTDDGQNVNKLLKRWLFYFVGQDFHVVEFRPVGWKQFRELY